MEKFIPDRKIFATGTSGILAWLIITIITATTGVVLPAGSVEGLSALIGLVTGYIIPPSQRDIIKRLNDEIVAIAAADPKIPVSPGTTIAKAATTIQNGVKALAPFMLALFLVGGLAACGQTTTAATGVSPSITAAPIKDAVEQVRAMPADQKWDLACAGLDPAYALYVAFFAAKRSDDFNAKAKATYDGLKVTCAAKPDNVAEGLITLVRSISAFKASLAKTAAT
jgi:hypothetical protein